MNKITNISATNFLGYGVNDSHTRCQFVFEAKEGQCRVEFPAQQLVNIAPLLHHLSLSIYQQSLAQNSISYGSIAQTPLIESGMVQIDCVPLTLPSSVSIHIQPKGTIALGYVFSQEQAEWLIKELRLALEKCKSIATQPLN